MAETHRASWSPDDSVVAWACGPWTFYKTRLLCALLGHHWRTTQEMYGEHADVIPWAGGCERCGITYNDPAAAAPEGKEGGGT